MKKKLHIQAVFAALILLNPVASFSAGLFNSAKGPDIITNNRIITTVHGHPISILDIQKEMDLVFFQKFPQYASSPEARFQFYEANFKPVGQQLIDKELILADAKENEMKITHAEVRQEIEKLFGPDIMGNLDKAGLSFDEAWQMTETDLTIRRTLSARVHSKAVKHVTPQRLRSFYTEFAKENQQEESWDYQVITVRGKDSESCLQTAQNISKVLEDQEVSLERLQKELKKRALLSKGTTISVTEEMKHTKQEIAEDLQREIASLTEKSYSEPIALVSKKTGKTVYRILYVNNYTKGGAPAFKEIEGRLQNFLVGQEIQKETVTYLAKLRKRYSDKENTLEELLPKEFTPFTLIH